MAPIVRDLAPRPVTLGNETGDQVRMRLSVEEVERYEHLLESEWAGANRALARGGLRNVGGLQV